MRSRSVLLAAFAAGALLVPILASATDVNPQTATPKTSTLQTKPQATAAQPVATPVKPATTTAKPAAKPATMPASHTTVRPAAAARAGSMQHPGAMPAASPSPVGLSTGMDVSFSGQIVDLNSYLRHEEMGTDRTAYAQRCTKSDEPMALVADDGSLYLLTASHTDNAAYAQARSLVGEKVTVTGAKHTRSALNGIEVHAVKSAARS